MKKIMNKDIINKIAKIAFVFLLLSLIPIIISSFYSHPTADDFGYSASVHNTVINGGNIIDVVKSSFEGVAHTYNSWQGTFAAVLVFSLQPGAFSENLYFLTTLVLLGSLIGSTILLISTLFKNFENGKKYGLIVSSIILLLSIHFVVNQHEAFFWWNGATYYTLFYSFSLILFSLLIKLYSEKKTNKKWIFYILSIILAILIGGGNYSTGLLTSVLFFFELLILFIKKDKKVYYYLPMFIVLIVSFLVSMIAPGNSVRGDNFVGFSPIRAIYESIKIAVKCIGNWTTFAHLVCYFLIGIIGFNIFKNSKFKIRYPLLVLALSILIFATQFTPPLYAMRNIGAGRQENIYYYSYVLLMAFNSLYLFGWLSQKDIIKINESNINKNTIVGSIAALVIFFSIGCVSYGLHDITFITTTLALRNNLPQTYDKEYKKVINEIKNGKQEVVDIKTYPTFFSPLKINKDPNYWINKQISSFYKIDHIKLKDEE